ncbi:unnamed protein product [Leuciscus chuanchicus]
MTTIRIVQVYAPTTAAEDDEIEQFYEDAGYISVIGKAFCTGSNHGLQRAKLTIDSRVEKHALAASNQAQRQTAIDPIIFRHYIDSADWAQTDEDITSDWDQFTERLRKARNIAAKPCTKDQTSRISDNTKAHLLKRRQMRSDSADHVEYGLLCKLVRALLKTNLEQYKCSRLLAAAEQKGSLKKHQRDGQEEPGWACSRFYTDLFASKTPVDPPEMQHDAIPAIPSVLTSEVRHAIQKDRTPGLDGIEAALLKEGRPTLWAALTSHFCHYMAQRQTPDQWKTAKTTLLYKKGDRELLSNYRLIWLLPTTYKVFTKVLYKRLARQLNEQQPPEQAGFWSGYSTMDHIHVLNQLLEHCREYKMPLVLAFIDYEKALDNVEINVLLALQQQGVTDEYVSLLQELNSGCATNITLFDRPLCILIARGVKQGDPISPKLFTASVSETCLSTAQLRQQRYQR